MSSKYQYSSGLSHLYSKTMAIQALGLLVYVALVNSLTSTSQAFILDHQLGMFACQANPSINSLSLYNISALCDGIPHCYNGLDEDRSKLECKSNCNPSCVHGTCLKGPQCYCDCDWGGKDCNIPDINECKNSPCHNMAFCTNTLGSYYCTCLPGFSGDGFNCKDIDECTNNKGKSQGAGSQVTRLPATIAELLASKINLSSKSVYPNPSKFCAKNAKCFNVPGSYYCQCNHGFSGDGYLGCEDIDECADPSISCGDNSECRNSIGNFECRCDKGFTLAPDKTCRDVDECAEIINPLTSQRYCHIYSDCINAIGGYACVCKAGFRGNGLVECIDIDECGDPSVRLCLPPATCHNTNGSYECLCPNGSLKQGDNCIVLVKDSNQCIPDMEPDANGCDRNSNCQPVDEFYKCVCNNGFFGNGTFCTDVDECRENPTLCSPGSCTNTIGAFYCSEQGKLGGIDHALETYFNGTIVIRPQGKVQKLEELASPSSNSMREHPPSQNLDSSLAVDNSISYRLKKYQGLHRTLGADQNEFIQITCKADGIQMVIDFAKSNLTRPFNGILYVKGNFKLKQCRRLIMNNLNPFHVTTFTAKYSDCNFDRNEESNEFSTIIVMQPHLKLLTFDAKAYKVFCMYDEIEKTVTNDLNVSMIAPQQILKATSAAPTCKMEVLDINGQAVTFTDLGSKLQLKIWLLQGGVKYGLRAKNCVAKTLAEDWEFLLVDKDGCSTDTKLFEDFAPRPDGSISAIFSAFKFPNSVYLRFKCEVKICLGSCGSPNCLRHNGSNAMPGLVKRDLNKRVTQTGSKSTLEERVESGLMEIKDRSQEKFYYLEDENDQLSPFSGEALLGKRRNSITHDSYYNSLMEGKVRLSQVEPKLTCVSRFGLLTGLTLTLIVAVIGGSGLALSVKKQIVIKNNRKLRSEQDSFGSNASPTPEFTAFESSRSNSPSFSCSDILEIGSTSSPVLDAKHQNQPSQERCFYNRAFSN